MTTPITHIIGKNAADNFKILSEADGDDYFFHLASFPSCFVILKASYVDTANIETAASACKGSTKFRNVPNLYVDYCACANVNMISSKLGSVSYTSRRKVSRIKV